MSSHAYSPSPRHLVEAHQQTEGKLKDQASRLLEVANISTKEEKLLHDKLDRVKGVEEANKEAKEGFSQAFGASVEEMVVSLESWGEEQGRVCGGIREGVGEQLQQRTADLAR